MAELYRKSSIEKLTNPEQLDKAITISSPMSWLALIGVVVIVAATILWSIFGTLPTTVSLSGIVAAPTDVCAIYSDYTGTITQVMKKAGDTVKKDDEVAKIKTADGKVQVIKAKEAGTISSVLVSEEEPAYIGAELFRLTPNIEQNQLVVCYLPSTYSGQIKKDMKVLLYPSSVDTQKTGHMEASVESVSEYSVNTANMWYVLGTDNLVAEQFASQGPVVAVVCKIKTDSSTKSGYWWSSSNGSKAELANGTFVSAKIVIDESAPITKLFNGIKEKLEG